MYPVGVLFGFGFDTASSIALLAVSALAKRKEDGTSAVRGGEIVVLPVSASILSAVLSLCLLHFLTPISQTFANCTCAQILFTAGMTLVDSLDSVLMLYSYAGFPEGWRAVRVFEDNPTTSEDVIDSKEKEQEKGKAIVIAVATTAANEDEPGAQNDDAIVTVVPLVTEETETEKKQSKDGKTTPCDSSGIEDMGIPARTTTITPDQERHLRVKMNVMSVKGDMMSGLSIVLTLMSILVAFRCVGPLSSCTVSNFTHALMTSSPASP